MTKCQKNKNQNENNNKNNAARKSKKNGKRKKIVLETLQSAQENHDVS